PSSQTRHTFAVDEPIGNQAHGPSDEITAAVPFGRAGRNVRPAPLAGPETGCLGRRRRREEARVLPPGCAGGTAWPAIDAGGRDAAIHPAVEARIAHLDGVPAAILIQMHIPTLPQGKHRRWRESDMDIGAGLRRPAAPGRPPGRPAGAPASLRP